MPSAATHSDAIRVIAGGVESRSLHAVGTIPGVTPLAAAGRNMAGTGYLRSRGDGTLLSWKPPTSSRWPVQSYGDDVDVSAGGDFLIVGGEDDHQWLRVHVEPAYLQPPNEAAVQLSEWFNNAIAGDNITAAEAAAGGIFAHELILRNDSGGTILGLVAQVDSGAADLGIWADEFPFPPGGTNEVELGDLAPAAEVSLWCFRSVAMGAPSAAAFFVGINLFWFGA